MSASILLIVPTIYLAGMAYVVRCVRVAPRGHEDSNGFTIDERDKQPAEPESTLAERSLLWHGSHQPS